MINIDKDNVPKHIAIIMDGNRRWARRKGLPDIKGHEAGADNLERIVEEAEKLGIKTLTVWALSTENLKERAKRELNGLFSLMRRGYRTKLKKMIKKGVHINILGELEGLPEIIKKIIEELRKTYIQNETIELNIALNYGGKRELITAIQEAIKDGIDINKLSEEDIAQRLYTKGQPDPELVIRTGGRIRTSSFMLWQTGYSELYFCDKLWPDFSPEDLRKAVAWYQQQSRNFGK